MESGEIVRVGEDVDLPLTGALTFGIVDRGTNLLQIRPVSGCNLSCPFCSVDEGPVGNKQARYEVSLDYLVEYAGAMVARKNCDDIEMHIDGCGEPLLYPRMVELVERLSSMEGVETVSMQTNGLLLDRDMIGDLEEAGLSRINLTINTMDSDKAKFMAGTDMYDLSRVLENAKRIADSKIDLLIAPVWIDGFNDKGIEDIVEYVIDIGVGEKWPALGIQKYREHKNGRKVDDYGEIPWRRFYSKLEDIEEKYNINLKLGPEDFGIYKVGFSLPRVFRRREKTGVKVMAPGWNPGQKLGVANHRTITILNGKDIPVGEKVTVEILKSKHNLYLARAV